MAAPAADPTPAEAWTKADASLHCVAIEISGVTGCINFCNGKYFLVPQPTEGHPPVYKQWIGAAERGLHIYYARDGRWHVGTYLEMRSRWPSWRFRSAACKPGTLPGMAGGWERLTVAGWLQGFARIIPTGRKQLEAAWDMAKATVNCVQVEITGVPTSKLTLQGWFWTSANGTYDLQLVESVLEPPIYRRRRQSFWERELWIYAASDGRWHVGTTYNKNRRRPGRRVRSSMECLRMPTGTGVMGPSGGATVSLPQAMQGWQAATFLGCFFAGFKYMPLPCGCVFWEQPQFGWNVVPLKAKGLPRAQTEDPWKGVKLPYAYRVTVTGGLSRFLNVPAAALSGVYIAQHRRNNRDAPSFVRKTGLVHNLWLYYSRDGHWHLGGTYEMNEHMPGWRLRSRECKPGKLPEETGWERLSSVGWASAVSRWHKSGWERLAYVGWTNASVKVEVIEKEPAHCCPSLSAVASSAGGLCGSLAAGTLHVCQSCGATCNGRCSCLERLPQACSQLCSRVPQPLATCASEVSSCCADFSRCSIEQGAMLICQGLGWACLAGGIMLQSCCQGAWHGLSLVVKQARERKKPADPDNGNTGAASNTAVDAGADGTSKAAPPDNAENGAGSGAKPSTLAPLEIDKRNDTGAGLGFGGNAGNRELPTTPPPLVDDLTPTRRFAPQVETGASRPAFSWEDPHRDLLQPWASAGYVPHLAPATHPVAAAAASRSPAYVNWQPMQVTDHVPAVRTDFSDCHRVGAAQAAEEEEEDADEARDAAGAGASDLAPAAHIGAVKLYEYPDDQLSTLTQATTATKTSWHPYAKRF